MACNRRRSFPFANRWICSIYYRTAKETAATSPPFHNKALMNALKSISPEPSIHHSRSTAPVAESWNQLQQDFRVTKKCCSIRFLPNCTITSNFNKYISHSIQR